MLQRSSPSKRASKTSKEMVVEEKRHSHARRRRRRRRPKGPATKPFFLVDGLLLAIVLFQALGHGRSEALPIGVGSLLAWSRCASGIVAAAWWWWWCCSSSSGNGVLL